MHNKAGSSNLGHVHRYSPKVQHEWQEWANVKISYATCNLPLDFSMYVAYFPCTNVQSQLLVVSCLVTMVIIGSSLNNGTSWREKYEVLARGEGSFLYDLPVLHQHLALLSLWHTVQISTSELVMIHWGDEVGYHLKLWLH